MSLSLPSLVAELDLLMLTFLLEPVDNLLCSNFSREDFLFSDTDGTLKSNFFLVLTGVVGQETYPPRPG